MGSNPSVFQGRRVGGDAARHPVDSVTWDDAQRFVRRLNEREKTTAYRLPTEFEWEYAARAGASADPTWDEIRELAWEQDVTTATTHPVGSKKPNPWGLHDMLGNVWEWVSDYYNEKVFADPVPPRYGATHVLKGGGFLADVKNAIVLDARRRARRWFRRRLSDRPRSARQVTPSVHLSGTRRRRTGNEPHAQVAGTIGNAHERRRRSGWPPGMELQQAVLATGGAPSFTEEVQPHGVH